MISSNNTVADGNSKRADVVGENTVSSVKTVSIICANLAGVRPTNKQAISDIKYKIILCMDATTTTTSVPKAGHHALDSSKNGAEQVGVVVATLVLKHRGDTLKTHASINVVGRQLLESLSIAIVLDKHKVPAVLRQS
jgi:hypothetical protein